ncbi:cation:proton antiporter [Plantibacter cousiniae (nom. nud.)]|uniref:Sodium/proton antiporter, CPA1 family n=1 Tax=Plantibacter cousiniae (nom. nud.) TaxID=199709 RepID=A0ABY1LRR0_9MICO|nr:cation:proton antiporter [Plantibacter cousiniae]SKC73943.1 sodium/proton antiporter, CPA1 family [Plantibacter cousiniae]
MDFAFLAVVAVVTIVAVARFANKLRVAAPLILVLVGLALSYLPFVPDVEVKPEWILAGVLPPLLYSAAVNVPLVDFRRNLKAISGLSVVLVVVSSVLIGWILSTILPDLSLAAGIALGAVVSPTDAVAATSIGKRLGMPSRLVSVLEGESLVNDASALVLLRSAIAATAGTVSLWGVLGDFAYAVALAIAIGIVVGFITVRIRSRLGDPVLTTVISFAVPFIAYLPAEHFHASGVLSVVVAGLYTGHQSAKYFTAQDRISERINWRTTQFLLENGVFLLMGLELEAIVSQVEQDDLGIWSSIGLGLLTAITLIVVRIVFVGVLVWSLRRDEREALSRRPRLAEVSARLEERPTENARSAKRKAAFSRSIARRSADLDFLQREGLGWRGGAVLAWAGMRGVVTIAAAQSLPLDTPYRAELVLIAFTVAIVTLLLQGGSLPFVIRLTRVGGTDEQAAMAELAGLVEEISTVGVAALDDPQLRTDGGEPFDSAVVDRVRTSSLIRVESAAERTDAGVGPHEQFRQLRRRVLDAERDALLDARATGSYSSEVLAKAQRMLDVEESRLDGAG